MTLKLNVVKGGDVRATTFHGRVVLPNEARHVWDLDSLQWYARARMMGENIVEISIKNNPHSLVCLEFYIEVDKLDPVHVVHVDAMLVFSSDIPEFNGTGFVSIKATSGTFTIESIGTKRSKHHNAGSFEIEFPSHPPVSGTYFVKKLSEKNVL